MKKLLLILTKNTTMKRLLLILLCLPLLFTSCEEDEIPQSVQTNSTTITPGNYFIDDCSDWSVDITFLGTLFWSEDNGAYFNIDSLHHYCELKLDTILMVANGVTALDLLEEGMYEDVPPMRAEVLYPNPGDPGRLELKFPGSIGISGSYIDPFQIGVIIEDINSCVTGVPYLITDCPGYGNDFVYYSYDAEYNVIFTTLDVANEVFEGTIDVQFSTSGSNCQPPQFWTTYPVGVSDSFSATIDFYFNN